MTPIAQFYNLALGWCLGSSFTMLMFDHMAQSAIMMAVALALRLTIGRRVVEEQG